MRDGASKKFCSRWDLNAGAMRDEQIRRGAPRGGGQTAEAEAEASRGQVPPARFDCGYRIMAIMSPFQGEDTGSIPVTRFGWVLRQL